MNSRRAVAAVFRGPGQPLRVQAFAVADPAGFASLVADWVPLAEVSRAFETARRSDVLRVGVRASEVLSSKF